MLQSEEQRDQEIFKSVAASAVCTLNNPKFVPWLVLAKSFCKFVGGNTLVHALENWTYNTNAFNGNGPAIGCGSYI